MQISRWEIPRPLSTLHSDWNLQCTTTAAASCCLQIRNSVCVVFVLVGEAAGSVDCCNAGTCPAHCLGNQKVPYSGGCSISRAISKSGSCQALSPPPEIFLCSLVVVNRETHRKRKEKNLSGKTKTEVDV